MGLTVLDLSAYVGLVAVGAVTLNMLLGVLMAAIGSGIFQVHINQRHQSCISPEGLVLLSGFRISIFQFPFSLFCLLLYLPRFRNGAKW